MPAGSTVRYQLVVKATGGTAHDVEVCDKLPDHMTYASLGTATLEDGKACWDFGDLSGSLDALAEGEGRRGCQGGLAHQQRHGDHERRGPRQGPRHGQGAGQARRQGQAQALRRRHRIAPHGERTVGGLAVRSPFASALPSDGMARRADFSLTASPGSLLAVAASASGATIVDEDGRSYLDACGGAMVMSLGHCHPRLVDVVQRQVAELSFTYRFSFRNGPMLELAEELRGVSPLADTWCFFNSSGSESVESAIQLALRYWQLRGHPGKTDLISRWPSFHGSTLGALSLSGSKWRGFYEPILAKHPVAPVPNADIRRRRAPAEEAAWAARELEDAIVRRGPQNVAAVVIEPVTGASGAAIARRPATSRSCGASATATTCCSCSTRRSRRSVARASGSPPATGPTRRPTSSRSPRA